MTMQPGASETAVVKKSRAVAYVLASIPIEWHRLCTASRIDASSSTTCTIAFSSDWGFIPLHPRPAGTHRHVLQSKAYCASRSEERRVGKECVSTVRYRWPPYH